MTKAPRPGMTATVGGPWIHWSGETYTLTDISDTPPPDFVYRVDVEGEPPLTIGGFWEGWHQPNERWRDVPCGPGGYANPHARARWNYWVKYGDLSHGVRYNRLVIRTYVEGVHQVLTEVNNYLNSLYKARDSRTRRAREEQAKAAAAERAKADAEELSRLRDLAIMVGDAPHSRASLENALGLRPTCGGCGRRLMDTDPATLCRRCIADDERDRAEAIRRALEGR